MLGCVGGGDSQGKSCKDEFIKYGHKKRTHERVLSHSSCPICDYAFYDRSDMLTHIVINDETRQTRERYLPEHMWKLLNEVELFVFDGKHNCYKIKK